VHKIYLTTSILFLLGRTSIAFAQNTYTANHLGNTCPNNTPTTNSYPIYEPFIKTYTNRFQKGLVNLKNKNKNLLQFIEYVLAKNGIPKQLKNLAIIESNLNHKTVSWVGAVGPWQFMPATARQFGLTINDTVDERYDIYKSTYAAAKYLKQLYQHYSNWNLVVAAYNSGTAHVDKAIKQNSSTSFWNIQYNLPTETRNHVKKFIGTSYIIDGSTTNDFHLYSNSSSSKTIKNEFAIETLTAGFRLDAIAEKLNINLVDLQQWNLDFEKQLYIKSEYALKLPINKLPDFLLYKTEILNLSIQKNISIN